MFDSVKKTYLMGLGLASLTREKVEEIVDDLVKRGEVAESDRRKVLDDLLGRAQEEQEKLSSSIRGTVEKVIRQMGLPSKREYEALEERLDKLERQILEMKGSLEDSADNDSSSESS